MLSSSVTLLLLLFGICVSAKYVAGPFVKWGDNLIETKELGESIVWIVQPGELSVRDLSLASDAVNMRQWIEEAKEYFSLPETPKYLEDGTWSKHVVSKVEDALSIPRDGKVRIDLPEISRNPENGAILDKSLNDQLVKAIKSRFDGVNNVLFVYSSDSSDPLKLGSNDQLLYSFLTTTTTTTTTSDNATKPSKPRANTKYFFQRYTIFSDAVWVMLLVSFTLGSVLLFGFSWLASLD